MSTSRIRSSQHIKPSTCSPQHTTRTIQDQRANNASIPSSTLPSRKQEHRANCLTTDSSSCEAKQSQQHNASGGHSSQMRDPHQSDDNDDEQFETVMAVNYTERCTVGCAYFTTRTQSLFVMEDMKLGSPELVNTLKVSVDPTAVLVPASPPIDRQNSWLPASLRLPYLFDSRPSREFGYESAKHKLSNVDVDQDNGHPVAFAAPGNLVTEDQYGLATGEQRDDRHGRLLRLSSLLDLDSKISVGCAGAVLNYIQRTRTNDYLPGDEAASGLLRIRNLQMFALSDAMLMSVDTLYALQIISTESHPNAHQQGPPSKSWTAHGAKEGLSVFGLFLHRAKTPQGRMLLRQYFLRPSQDLEVINERLSTISLLLRPENTEHLDHLVKQLARVKNMRSAMVKMRKGISLESAASRHLSSSTFAALRQFSYHALCICDELREIEGMDRLLIADKVLRTFDTHRLADIGRLISNTIDIEASKEQHRTVVLPGVDLELDEAKRTYDGLEHLLSIVAEHIVDDIPSELKSGVSVIFFPQIGFLVSVRVDPRTRTGVYEGIDEDKWERMFLTETHAYYKCAVTIQLDKEYGDVYAKMCDREIEIAQKLAEYILESGELINAVSDTCGELDCLVALACGARDLNLSRPEVTDANTIQIVGGRHILQELTVPAFVVNDTSLCGGSGGGESAASTTSSPNMVIMTGPNYSGKSIYLKQVALITYMAHVGSFVPAASAQIGLTDQIFTRIATRESLSKTSSAFMTDLQQITMALQMATRRSLLIIDEFGKGTDAADGAGLAAGVFEHLLSRGIETPKVLAATHWHEIFEAGFLLPRAGLEFAHMEVLVDEAGGQIDKQVTHLYSYKQGRSVQSFGTCCAAMNGVPPPIVARAEQLILLAAKGCDLVEACTELPKEDLAELDRAENIARHFLSLDDTRQPRVILEQLLAMDSTERHDDPDSITS